jgi:hypothetical protein
MKGILKKTQSGWIVNYDYTVNKNDWCTLPLHPADVEQINKDSQVFDNIEARIAAYSEVEFEIVTEYWSGEVGVNGLTYAKLLHHSVESNEMIDHIGDANEMVENYNQIIGKPLEDYVREKHSQDRCMGFIDGYNKAQENLYTKQDVIDSVVRMYDIFMDDTLEAKMLRLKGISWHIQNTLESLKQPKK